MTKRHFHGPALGVLSVFVYFFNTVFWSLPILSIAGMKLLVPAKTWRTQCTRVLNRLAVCWVGVNKAAQRLLLPTRWEVSGMDDLPENGWYLVLANHQSWVDILVLQRIFHGRIPFLKFFLKKELFWYPILGLCWWALDFPFIQRYSPKFLAKNPHLKGKDIETTRKACEKFSQLPVSVMNFVEGTRFTKEKRAALKSPYTHLLRPRAAGIALMISGLSNRLQRIVDVTIVYPEQVKGFWSFACGEIGEIRVNVRSLPVTEDLIGDYAADRKYRVRFHRWLNQLWWEKDLRIDRLLGLPAQDPGQRYGPIVPEASRPMPETVET
jgi:1-acyl-sn-glycerol-3-phosphate acyltransferase